MTKYLVILLDRLLVLPVVLVSLQPEQVSSIPLTGWTFSHLRAFASVFPLPEAVFSVGWLAHFLTSFCLCLNAIFKEKPKKRKEKKSLSCLFCIKNDRLISLSIFTFPNTSFLYCLTCIFCLHIYIDLFLEYKLHEVKDFALFAAQSP